MIFKRELTEQSLVAIRSVLNDALAECEECGLIGLQEDEIISCGNYGYHCKECITNLNIGECENCREWFKDELNANEHCKECAIDIAEDINIDEEVEEEEIYKTFDLGNIVDVIMQHTIRKNPKSRNFNVDILRSDESVFLNAKIKFGVDIRGIPMREGVSRECSMLGTYDIEITKGKEEIK